MAALKTPHFTKKDAPPFMQFHHAGTENGPTFKKYGRLFGEIQAHINNQKQKRLPKNVKTVVCSMSVQELYDTHDAFAAGESHFIKQWMDLFTLANPQTKIVVAEYHIDKQKYSTCAITYSFENFCLTAENLGFTGEITARVMRVLKKTGDFDYLMRKSFVNSGEGTDWKEDLYPVFDTNIGELIQIVDWKVRLENEKPRA